MKIKILHKTIVIDIKVLDNRPIQTVLRMFKEDGRDEGRQGFEKGNVFIKGEIDRRIPAIKLLRTREFSKILINANIVPQEHIQHIQEYDSHHVGLLYAKEFVEFYLCDIPSSHFNFEKV